MLNCMLCDDVSAGLHVSAVGEGADYRRYCLPVDELSDSLENGIGDAESIEVYIRV